MKTAGTTVTLVLAVFCYFSGVASQDINKILQKECEEFWPLLRSGHFYCNRDNNPVRGPDGETHTNKCVMCRKMMTKQVNSTPTAQTINGNRSFFAREDECSEYRSQVNANGELTCTKENDPVRDSSGRQHSNKCLMCAAKFKEEAQKGIRFGGNNQQPNGNSVVGRNTNQKGCGQLNSQQRVDGTPPCAAGSGCVGTQQGTAQYGGNCGAQGSVTRGENQGVGNSVNIQLDCRQILQGVKGEAVLCRNSWEPVCGTDGKTYSNSCYLCSEMARTGNYLMLRSEGECTNTAPARADCSQYPQTKGRVLCRRSTQLVCGTDGVTHSNECMLCDRILKTKTEIGIKHIGACPQI